MQLFGTCNVTCIFVFRADTSAVDERLVRSSLTRVTPPTPSLTQLPTVLCVGLGPCEIFLTHFGIPAVVFPVQLTWVVMMVRLDGQASDITRKHNLTAKSFMVFLPSLSQCSLSPRCECTIPTGTGLYNSPYWLVGVFCNGLCLLQREGS